MLSKTICANNQHSTSRVVRAGYALVVRAGCAPSFPVLAPLPVPVPVPASLPLRVTILCPSLPVPVLCPCLSVSVLSRGCIKALQKPLKAL